VLQAKLTKLAIQIGYAGQLRSCIVTLLLLYVICSRKVHCLLSFVDKVNQLINIRLLHNCQTTSIEKDTQ